MIVFRAPGEVPAGFGPSVVVIGKFDGVHSGHRAVIDRARVTATDADARVVAVTFDRNPLSLLRPELCPDPLSSVEQKLELLAEAGVDATLVLRFDAELAGLEPRAFVEHVLVDAFGVVTVMVGDDFRFGRGGAGDPALLISLGAEFGFEVDVVGDVQGGGRRVSSTWVRDLLSVGDVEGAARLLGRPHAMAGEVVHGLKRGRELGFPTANLAPDADGFIPGVKAFTAAVLGGIGSLPGAVVGGLLIGLIEALWSAYFSIDYKDVAAFSILAIVLIFMPSGILGRPEVEKV